MPVLALLDFRGTGVSATKIAAVKAIFDAQYSAARTAHPRMKCNGWI
jgi:hypothetical protein